MEKERETWIGLGLIIKDPCLVVLSFDLNKEHCEANAQKTMANEIACDFTETFKIGCAEIELVRWLKKCGMGKAMTQVLLADLFKQLLILQEENEKKSRHGKEPL